MKSYEEALTIILSKAKTLKHHKIELAKAKGHILAEDVSYDVNIPPFDKSAMDGFACKRDDLNKELELIEVIFAGKKPEHKIGPNQCAKIMTGAVVPEGADCVFMVEHSEMIDDNHVKCTPEKTNTNICYKAEDVKVGDLALAKNTLIKAQHLPILAGAGIHHPLVFDTPKIKIFATGSELVEPNEKPLKHQIRNSNSSQMLAQVSELGIEGDYLGIIKDDKELTENTIQLALEQCDILILSGGVSVGDYDFIPETIEKLGFNIHLTQSAIQPGKPILFASKGKQYVFGLAGNPVSSFVQFHIYVRPFIYTLMGHKQSFDKRNGITMTNYERRKTNRLKFIPGVIDEQNQVFPVEYHGSAHIHAFAQANCLIEIPIEVAKIQKGDSVNVRPI